MTLQDYGLLNSMNLKQTSVQMQRSNWVSKLGSEHSHVGTSQPVFVEEYTLPSFRGHMRNGQDVVPAHKEVMMRGNATFRRVPSVCGAVTGCITQGPRFCQYLQGLLSQKGHPATTAFILLLQLISFIKEKRSRSWISPKSDVSSTSNVSMSSPKHEATLVMFSL